MRLWWQIDWDRAAVHCDRNKGRVFVVLNKYERSAVFSPLSNRALPLVNELASAAKPLDTSGWVAAPEQQLEEL